MGLQIRPLWGPDLTAEFFDVLNALAPVTLSAEAARRVFQRRLGQGWRTVIAVKDGKIAGTASLLVEAKFIRGTGAGGLVGHIEDVAVLANQQRQGIGRALVGHLVEMARAEGCYKVILCCSAATQRFYEACGFHAHEVGMRLDLTAPQDATGPTKPANDAGSSASA